MSTMTARLTKTSNWYPGHCYVETMLFERNARTNMIDCDRKILKQNLPGVQGTARPKLPKIDLDVLMPPLPHRSMHIIRIISTQSRAPGGEETYADQQDRLHDCNVLDSVLERNGFSVESIEAAICSTGSTVTSRYLEGTEDELRGRNIAFQCRSRRFCSFWRYDSETACTRVIFVRFEPPDLVTILEFASKLRKSMHLLRQCFGHSMLPILLFGEFMRQGTMAKFKRDSEELRAIELQVTLDSAHRISTMQTLRRLGGMASRSRLVLVDVTQALEQCREINARHYLHETDSTPEDRSTGAHVLLHLQSLKTTVDSDMTYLDYIATSVEHQLQTFSMIANMTDGTSLKTIAILNLVFLPAMFVASMFAMPVFPATAPDLFWTFWAAAVPLTVLVLAVWFGWWYWRVAHRYYDDPSQNVLKTLRVWRAGAESKRQGADLDPTFHMRRRLAGDAHRTWFEDFNRGERLQVEKRAAAAAV